MKYTPRKSQVIEASLTNFEIYDWAIGCRYKQEAKW